MKKIINKYADPCGQVFTQSANRRRLCNTIGGKNFIKFFYTPFVFYLGTSPCVKNKLNNKVYNE